VPETRKNPQDLDMVIYVYPKGAERNKKNAIAIFVYDQKETSIYGKPQTSMQKVLNGYKDKIRTELGLDNTKTRLGNSSTT